MAGDRPPATAARPRRGGSRVIRRAAPGFPRSRAEFLPGSGRSPVPKQARRCRGAWESAPLRSPARSGGRRPGRLRDRPAARPSSPGFVLRPSAPARRRSCRQVRRYSTPSMAGERPSATAPRPGRSRVVRRVAPGLPRSRAEFLPGSVRFRLPKRARRVVDRESAPLRSPAPARSGGRRPGRQRDLPAARPSAPGSFFGPSTPARADSMSSTAGDRPSATAQKPGRSRVIRRAAPDLPRSRAEFLPGSVRLRFPKRVRRGRGPSESATLRPAAGRSEGGGSRRVRGPVSALPGEARRRGLRPGRARRGAASPRSAGGTPPRPRRTGR